MNLSEQKFEVFPWNNNFSVGIDEIDEQHQVIVSLLNKLAGHMVMDEADELAEAFEELSNYAEHHFSSEIEIWGRCLKEDSSYIAHLKTHDSFLPTVMELKSRSEIEGSHTVLGDVIGFLVHWLASHILSSDKRMALMLAEVSSGKSLEEAEVYANKVMSEAVKELIETVMSMYDKLSSRTLELMKERLARKRAEEALIAAKETAEKANALKDKFVNLVAHDIRNPLGVVIGYSEILSKSTPSLSQKQHDYVQAILTSGQAMDTIVNELLDLGRLQSGIIEVNQKPFNGYKLVKEIFERFSAQSAKKNIQLTNHISEEVVLLGDEGLLGQVIQNLVSNALKFSKPGSEVRVDMSCDETSVVIAVRDKGIGIPLDSIPKLFRLDEKVSTVGTDGEKGTGFGLPYSKEIMTAHGGDLRVESKEGQGSAFLIILPQARSCEG